MTRWLDFSGAPPLLIPARLVGLWEGGLLSGTGEYSDLNIEDPRTDYDRACKAAWPGRGILQVGDGSALVLYTEFDEHTWDSEHALVSCGSWLPTADELAGAQWSDRLVWESTDTEFVLMNSAASGAAGLHPDEFLEVQLQPGRYLVEYTALEAAYVGCFHRFKHLAPSASAA